MARRRDRDRQGGAWSRSLRPRLNDQRNLAAFTLFVALRAREARRHERDRAAGAVAGRGGRFYLRFDGSGPQLVGGAGGRRAEVGVGRFRSPP